MNTIILYIPIIIISILCAIISCRVIFGEFTILKLKKYPAIAFGKWSIEESNPLNSEKIKRLERITIHGVNTPICWKSWNEEWGDEFK